jgi:hypothetical protein
MEEFRCIDAVKDLIHFAPSLSPGMGAAVHFVNRPECLRDGDGEMKHTRRSQPATLAGSTIREPIGGHW